MEPYGILQLGTILEEVGHQVLVIDVFPDNPTIFLNQVRKFKPELVGFSIETPAYAKVMHANSYISKHLPSAIRCAGGVHTSARPESTLRDMALDFVVYGEADVSFPQVVKHITHKKDWQDIHGICFLDKKDNFIQNPPASVVKNLDDLPILNRRLNPYHDYYFSPPGNIRGMFNDRSTQMMTARGCPFDCTFCSSRVIFGKRIRRRSVPHVIDEIRYLKNSFHINTLFFVDDTFTVQPGWVVSFCEQLIKQNIKITWCCQSRADTISPDLLQLMKRAGCIQIDIGIESGSPKVLKALKKGETPAELESAVNIIKAAGLRVLCSFVVGSPEEDIDDIKMTADFVRRTRPTISQYYTLSPYPGSPLYNQAIENNWIEEGNFDESWSLKCSLTSPMHINFDSNQLMELRAELENLSSFRDNLEYFKGLFRHPKYIWKMACAVIRYRGSILQSMVNALKNRRFHILVLDVYRRFNQYLLMQVLKREKIIS